MCWVLSHDTYRMSQKNKWGIWWVLKQSGRLSRHTGMPGFLWPGWVGQEKAEQILTLICLEWISPTSTKLPMLPTIHPLQKKRKKYIAYLVTFYSTLHLLWIIFYFFSLWTCFFQNQIAISLRAGLLHLCAYKHLALIKVSTVWPCDWFMLH